MDDYFFPPFSNAHSWDTVWETKKETCDFCKEDKTDLIDSYGRRRICPDCRKKMESK